MRLAAAGVRTPEVLAYAVYPAFGPFVRADVMTRLMRGLALPEAWSATTSTDEARAALVDALARLLGALAPRGRAHPDLNVRNVLVLAAAGATAAAILDVDRVTLRAPRKRGCREAKRRVPPAFDEQGASRRRRAADVVSGRAPARHRGMSAT